MDNFEETAEKISLHGLGFLQVKLKGMQRLHIWHPDLPRRSCFEHSSIHDHRFDFASLVLCGVQVNDRYREEPYSGRTQFSLPDTYFKYVHEGPRGKSGNRPWIATGSIRLVHCEHKAIVPGCTYFMTAGDLHSTTPSGDGKVATIMTKTFEGTTPARSLCKEGVTPDVDFDRRQMSEDAMWAIVRDVLSK